MLCHGLALLAGLVSLGYSRLSMAQAGASCPLPLMQQIDAIHAFAEMMPVFRHPRCLNCHGGVDPLSEAHRGADQVEPKADRKEFNAQCQMCHDGLAPHDETPGWSVPGEPVFFVDKSDEELCLQMKQFEPTGEDFVGHIFNDHGPENTQFIAAAFVGDRALGEGLADYGLAIEKPPGTQAELTAKARKWVDILGEGWKSSRECGCVVRFEGTFTQTEDVATGAVHQKYTITGDLVWTPGDGKRSFADTKSAIFKPSDGSITVVVDDVNRGAVGKCEYDDKKTFSIAKMSSAALQYLSLEIAEDGRYRLSLGMPSQYLPMQVAAKCKARALQSREPLPNSDAAIQIGVQERMLTGEGVVGRLATPIRQGLSTISGRWSFGAGSRK
jgi:hypothetical protein